MVVRQVIESFTVPLDYRREFRLELPPNYVEGESELVKARWDENFHESVNRLCTARRRNFGGMTLTLRLSVFKTAMDRVCNEFSGRTNQLKVHFEETSVPSLTNRSHKVTYRLRISKLSEIPEAVLQARQYCSAEIPEREPLAVAHLVQQGVENENSTTVSGAIIVDAVESPPSHIEAPTAIVTVLDEETSEEDSESPQRSVLERMEQLESIRAFLSPEEFDDIRKKIIDSI